MRYLKDLLLICAVLGLWLGSATPGTAQGSCGETYTVARKDSLTKIAHRCDLSLSLLILTNPHIKNPSRIYPGDVLTIPKGPALEAQKEDDSFKDGRISRDTLADWGLEIEPGQRWIEVDISEQTVRAYVSTKLLRSFIVSTGTWRHPTPTGQYEISIKLREDDMDGPGYRFEDVPYTMYFYRDYSLHGTYWHDDFGVPKSHGCINLTIEDAEWLFGFASEGTLVYSHL